VRRATVARTDGLDLDRGSFWTFRGDLEQFVPLWGSSRVLAFRGFVSWSEPVGGSSIPFQRLMVNDDPDLLRGYQDLRFRDRGMTALSAEYRWPVWADRTPRGAGVDAYLLGDVGQVFGSRNDLAVDQLTASYGGGLRFIGARGFVGRLEIAWSDEERKIRLRADQVFQFEKGGIYHGRNPVPTR
jgi:hemolysin activation/secretion protein